MELLWVNYGEKLALILLIKEILTEFFEEILQITNQ